MPNWYWEKKELRATPSQEKGMDFDTETRYRREGVRFIMELGKNLNLSHNTMATGAVYYHRFYMFHAFQDFNRYVVSTCCLFLAGKAEETPKKCKDILRTVRQLTNDRQFAFFGADPREEIMVLERVLLQTIKFDLQVDHPYTSILLFAKSLKGDRNKLQKMVQMSWTFVNDSLCTTVCLQWEPEIIAIAVMYLAVKLSKFEVKDWANRLPNHHNWWDQFVEDLDTSDLEEICHQVLDLYTQPVTATKEAATTPPPGAAPKVQHVTPKPAKPKVTPTVKPITPSPAPPSHTKSRPHTPPPPPNAAIPPIPTPPVVPPPPAPSMPPQGPNVYSRPPMPQVYPAGPPSMVAGAPPPSGYPPPMGYPPGPPGYPNVPPYPVPPGYQQGPPGPHPHGPPGPHPHGPPGYQQGPPGHPPPPHPHGPYRGHSRY